MARPLVIDTNIALDLLVFRDPLTAPLQDALTSGEWRWIATAAMRAELARVLDYPHLVPRLRFHGLDRDTVLARFDTSTEATPAAPKAPVTCRDPDDQGFIDLAVWAQAPLLSKDQDVRRLRKRLHAHGVWVGPHWPPAHDIFKAAL